MAELAAMAKALPALAVGKVQVLDVDASSVVGPGKGQQLRYSPAQMAVTSASGTF
jgi:hypothetical protein